MIQNGKFENNQYISPMATWLAEDVMDQTWNALDSFKMDPTWKEHANDVETSSTMKADSGSVDKGGK
jgi:hypothetical protein